MWITGKVDLPREVIDAHREGRLVLFVGAGASYDCPSNLQTFDELALDVAKVLGATDEVLTHFLKRPDALLGHLATRDPQPGYWPVHELVKEKLSDPASKPNENHKAIMRIAATSGVMRVVTTNFDDHLASHAGAATISIPNVYVGPALPLGRDFSGLVHLHGSVLRPASEFGLSDADFGAAYLTDSWAARFLYPMFSNFVVLFVGYSHQDVVMNYLARGLPESQTRYALTPDPDGSEWRPLNVKAIGYPTAGSSHAALTEALSAWADLTEMGALDHRSRIRDIVTAPPTVDRAELDYLTDAIAMGYGAHAFRDYASHSEWLGWLSKTDVFEPNLTRSAPTEASNILARWFAERATESDENTIVVLEILRGQRVLSKELWVQIASCVSGLTANPERFETWVSVLLSFPINEFDVHAYLTSLLNSCEMPTHKNALFALLRSTLTPKIELSTPMYGHAQEAEEPALRRPYGEIVWSVDRYWAEETWKSKLRPNLPLIADELLSITEEKLRAACRLLAGYDGGEIRFDRMSFRRSAIEVNAEDAHRDLDDTIIDVLRDCLDFNIENAPNRAEALINTWLEDPFLIFQRLALYGIARSAGSAATSADTSIGRLLEKGLLFKQGLRYEVFQLLRVWVPDTSSGVRDRLLSEISSADLDPEHGDRARYNLLGWLRDSTPDWHEAKEYFASLQDDNPDFTPRSKPELASSITTGFREHTPPFTDSDLSKMLKNDAVGALSSLLTFNYGDRWSGPRWEDALEQVTRSVAACPAHGLLIWDAAQTLSADPRLREVSNAVLHGWSREALPNALWGDVLHRISSYKEIQDLEYYLAELLLAGVSNREHEMPDEELATAVELADRLWPIAVAKETSPTSEDWMSAGLNSSAGELTQFFVAVLSRARFKAGEGWTGLDDQMAARLTRTLDDNRVSLGGSKAILGFQLLFLFHADEEFCVREVFPLMSGGHKSAEQLWSGYLHSNRVDLRILELGFAEVVVSFRKNIASLSEDLRRNYYALAGRIAGATSPLPSGPVHFSEGFLSIDRPDQNSEFLNAIASLLQWQEPEEVQKSWCDWLGEFTTRLATGAPVALTTEQWSAVAGWTPHLAESFPAAVQLILKRPARLSAHAVVLHEIEKTTVPETYPEACRDLIAHLLRDVDSPFWGATYLKAIVLRLKERLGNKGIKVIVERAMAGGIYEAAEWAEL